MDLENEDEEELSRVFLGEFNPKTYIKEVFEAVRWSKDTRDYIATTIRGDKDFVSNIFFPLKAKKYLEENNIAFSDIIATGFGKSKSEAESNVYKLALSKLKEYGFTKEWAKGEKTVSKYFTQALNKALDEGFAGLKLIKDKKSAIKWKQLIGVDEDGFNTILITDIMKKENVKEFNDRIYLAYINE